MNRQDAKKEPDDQTDSLARAVVDAAIEVHRALGPGFLESVYEEAMAHELQLRGIPFVRQSPVAISYKGHLVGQGKLDFLIDARLVVDLKAVECFAPIHTAKMISYLKTTRLQLGLLINFNSALLTDGIKRVVLSDQ
jgi:GxxExxY protein